MENLENEVWKDVIGHEEFYQVSNLGRVRVLDRNIRTKWGGTRFQPMKIMKQQNDKDGYKIVTLNNNSKTRRVSVHRLVAASFIPNPNKKKQVNHINGVKFDNGVENLEWCTVSENGLHAYRVLKINHHAKGKFGSSNPVAKGVIQCSKEGVEINRFNSMVEAGEAIGIDSAGISSCVKTRQKTAGGFKWKYS